MKNKGLIIGIIIAIVVVVIVVAVIVGGNILNKEKNNTGKVDNGTNQSDKVTNVIDNNDAYFIAIDGKKFFAGDKLTSLSSVGYNIKSTEADEEIPANKYMIGAGGMMNSAKKTIFSVTPFNTKNSSIKISESVIGGIDLSYTWAKNDERSANFEVYGGLKFGSTEEEVKKVFGEPSLVTNLTDSKVYRYNSKETYRSYKFTFDKDNKVSAIEWQNLVFNKK